MVSVDQDIAREVGIMRDPDDTGDWNLAQCRLQDVFDAGVLKAKGEGREYVSSYGVVGLAPT